MTRLTPDDADRIFTSHVDERDLELGSLAAFVREVRETYTRAPDADTQARHLRAMAEAFRAGSEPLAPKRRRSVLRRAAVAAFAGTFLIGGSALAATGNLPDPAQDALSDAARVVGVTIPSARQPSPTGQEQGDAGKARADENKARAKAFTDAKKAWTECVAAKAPEGGTSSFDPEAPPPAGCGPKPAAQDFQPTRTNPAGNENRGKGEPPSPKPGKPSGAGRSSDEQPGKGRGPTPSPDAPWPGRSHSAGNGSPGNAPANSGR